MKVTPPPDFSEDDPMLKQTIIHTPAGAAPAEKPAGAMNSVFDMAAAAPTVDVQKPINKARELNRRRLLDVLQRGEGSGAALAKVAGISQPTASEILRELMEEGLVESNGKKSNQVKFRLRSGTTAEGFKSWLSDASRAPYQRKESTMPSTKPKVVAAPMTTSARRAGAQPDRAPAPPPTWSCALESSGHLVIRANGESVTLDAQQARGLTGWLQRVDAALAVALEA